MPRNCRTSFVSGFLSGLAAMAYAHTPDTPPGLPPPAATTSVPQVTSAPVDSGILRFRSTDFSFLFNGNLDRSFPNPASGCRELRAFHVRPDMCHVDAGELVTAARAELFSWGWNDETPRRVACGYGSDKNAGPGAGLEYGAAQTAKEYLRRCRGQSHLPLPGNEMQTGIRR